MDIEPITTYDDFSMTLKNEPILGIPIIDLDGKPIQQEIEDNEC